MHGYVIAIGRITARLFYRGGLIHHRDPWTYELAEAAWFCSADAARCAADTLHRWRDAPEGDRSIEYHHLTDRQITGTTWHGHRVPAEPFPEGDEPADALNPSPLVGEGQG
jgi:hypothetical protein